MIDLSFEQFVAFVPGFLIWLTNKLKPYTGDWTRLIPLCFGIIMMTVARFAFETQESLIIMILYGFVMGYSAIYAYDQAKKSSKNTKVKTLLDKNHKGDTIKKTAI